MYKLGKSVIIILVCFLAIVWSWNEMGHMLVSEIAYLKISDEVRTKFETEMNMLNDFYPEFAGYLAGAPWLDKIRRYHTSQFASWHYIDRPYPLLIKNINRCSGGIVWALNSIQTTLQKSNDKLSRGLFIRFLVHLIGDLHQPLHNIAYFNHNFPKGDYGGNLFKIKYHSTTLKLHEFWDTCAHLYLTKFTYPLSPSEISHLKSTAQHLLSSYHRDLPQLTYRQWSHVSYQFAITNIYDHLQNSTVLTPTFISQSQYACQKQIVEAGLHLSQILTHLYSSSSFSKSKDDL